MSDEIEKDPQVLLERLKIFKGQRDDAMDRAAIMEADARLLLAANKVLREQNVALRAELDKVLNPQEPPQEQ